MRIFISGKMTGTDDFPERFNEGAIKARMLLGGRPAEVVNPVYVRFLIHGISDAEAREICIELLRKCDAIYMLRGWECSKGASLELQEAMSAGLTVYCEEDE